MMSMEGVKILGFTAMGLLLCLSLGLLAFVIYRIKHPKYDRVRITVKLEPPSPKVRGPLMHGKLLSATFPLYATHGLELQTDNESDDSMKTPDVNPEEVMIPQHPRWVTGPAHVPPPLRAQATMLSYRTLASTTSTINLPGAVDQHEEDAPADAEEMTSQRNRMTAILISQGLVPAALWSTEYPQRPDDDSVFDSATTDDEMV